jgi:hypothetical protein
MYDIQHCFICRPSDSTVSEDAGIEPRTVATTAFTVRRSNHSARSHPQSARSHPQWLDLIHSRLYLIHTRLYLIHTRLDLIHSRLDLIKIIKIILFTIFNPSLLFCLTYCCPTCRKGKRYAFTHSATGETVTEVPPPAQNGIHPPPPSGIE